MPVAFVGDAHFGRKAENPAIKKHVKDGQKAYFTWLASDLRKRGITRVFFSGDIFDTRNSVNVEALVETKRMFQNTFKGIEVTIILGNHDMYYENSYDICSTELLADIPNVRVYHTDKIMSESLFGHTMYMVPWTTSDKLPELVSFLDGLKKTRSKNILFGHFEMMGVDMEGGNISTFGLSPNMFADAARYVFSGHYHGQSTQQIDGSDILYLGSPYPLTFANSDTNHGYWVLGEDMKMEFVKNDISPTFTTIFDTDDMDVIGDLSTKFVRLYLNSSKTKEEVFAIRSLIDAKKPLFINIVPYKNGSEEVKKSYAQRESNKLLNMDLFSLSEIYIDNNSESLPKLRDNLDAKSAILSRIKDYTERLTIKK